MSGYPTPRAGLRPHSARIGIRARSFRAEAGMSQLELSDALRSHGVHWGHAGVSRFEAGGRVRLDIDELYALATVLDVTVERLLNEEPLQEPEVRCECQANWRCANCLAEEKAS